VSNLPSSCIVNFRVYKLEVAWVKGHNRSVGNERVVEEAKKAARGDSSSSCNLPEFLTEKVLPLSMSALKQEYDWKLKDNWRDRWKESPRHDIQKNCSSIEGNAEIAHEPDSTALHRTHSTKPLLAQNHKDGYFVVPLMQSQGGVST